LLLAAVVGALIMVVAFALQHEFASRPTGAAAAAPTADVASARALSAAEEAYATALWPIHREVKLAALGMTFAGIAYKTESLDQDVLEAKIEPLNERLRAAVVTAQGLAVPASLRDVHERYLGALTAYEDASEKMIEAARDGRDELLIEAQRLSFGASEDTLRVGDVLWPGEYKPH
jgi:hypothetical protein